MRLSVALLLIITMIITYFVDFLCYCYDVHNFNVDIGIVIAVGAYVVSVRVVPTSL